MESYFIFVLTEAGEKDLERTKQVLAFVRKNKQICRNAGVDIKIEPVTYEQLQNPKVQKMLADKYEINGLPALFIPANRQYPKETHVGLENIFKFMSNVVDAGKAAVMNKLEDIIEPESDMDRVWKTDLTMDKHATSGNDPDDTLSTGISSMEIHKKMAAFTKQKPGLVEQDEFNNGLETKGTQNAKPLQNNKSGNLSRPPPTRPAAQTPPKIALSADEDLLDKHMKNNLGVDDNISYL